MKSAKRSTVLVWFRRDLRLFDHAALFHALETGAKIVPVFIFDEKILGKLPRVDRRVVFIHDCLVQLKSELISHESNLLVRVGDPAQIIPELLDEFDADTLFANRDYEPYAIQRDSSIALQLQERGREFKLFKDQVIFERDQILNQQGRMYQVFTPYKSAWLKQLDPSDLQSFPVDLKLISNPDLAGLVMPSLAELGFKHVDIEFLKPGVAGAEVLVNDFFDRIDQYHETRDFPGIKGVSYLSVHLRFGTVSVRELVRYGWQRGGKGAETWVSELIWREFYQQLLWHRPELETCCFQSKYDSLKFQNDPKWFEAWCQGMTGFPIVDAAMRQLNQSGFMHNRLRMIAASFLVKDLLIDWRWGERYFAEKLNDYDLAANNGGWQWAASTGCDAQPYFRIFNPTSQSKKFDPDGKFIKRYCPELQHLDSRAIHAPPDGVANYPTPIVNHDLQRHAVLQLFSQC